MARAKKTMDDEVLETSAEVIEEAAPLIVISEAPAYQTVEINGKQYKRWMDANGVTFTELL